MENVNRLPFSTGERFSTKMWVSSVEKKHTFYNVLTSEIDGKQITFSREVTNLEKEMFYKTADDFIQEFTQIFDSICPQFDKKIEKFGQQIFNKFGNRPDKVEFINWFIKQKVGGWSFNPTFKDGILIDAELHFPNYKESFLPPLQDEILIEYCKMEYLRIENLLEIDNKLNAESTDQQPEQITDHTKGKGFESPDFDDLFTEIEKKNEVWQYMIDLHIIDKNGIKTPTLKPYFIISFIEAMQSFGLIQISTKKYLQVKAFTIKIYGAEKRINENSAIIKDELIKIKELLSKK